MAKVSVIMPVYNGAKYLGEAIESILGQTYKDFEFLILNDGSTDESLAIVRSFDDRRIRVIDNGRNLGLIATLNRGFEEAKGDYLVRMDADDRARPQRIHRQLDYLEKNPAVGVVGSFVSTLGSDQKNLRFPVEHEDIFVHALFDSPLVHPSVTIRRTAITGVPYDSSYVHAEDYELWSRLLQAGVRFHILPERLLEYRVHGNQVSSAHRVHQLNTADDIRGAWLSKLGLQVELSIIERHRQISASDFTNVEGGLEVVWNHLNVLLLANRRSRLCNEGVLKQFLGRKWMTALDALSSQKWEIRTLIGGPFWMASHVSRPIFWRLLFRYFWNIASREGA